MKKLVFWILASVFLGLFSMPVLSKEFTRLASSDNGDGTFSNPVLFGDFPDMDVVRVGDTYYMVSTTMFVFPGATLLKSHDLVNWQYCANPLRRIENSAPYNLENGQNRYSHGQWATALDYHDGKFYMLFLTLDEGGYLLTAEDPEGDWDIKRLQDAYYDCGILTEDGETYVVYGINDLRVALVDHEFRKLRDEHVATGAFDSGVEGSRFYHIGDYYYIYATYPGWPARQTIFRSKNIWGPYEEKMVLADGTATHQGALVETSEGEWWTLLFRDNGPLGRMPFLLPVIWEDGWPIIGTDGKAGMQYEKPTIAGDTRITPLPTDDSFRNHTMAPQWGWNHNPDDSKWSLTKRPGFLRLYTASVTDNPYQARNTLTQRVLGYHQDQTASFGTVAIDISHMAEGDICGFGMFQDPLAFIGIKKNDGEYRLIYRESSLTGKRNETCDFGKSLDSDLVYLRAVPSFKDGKCRFSYSIDNKTYFDFGKEFRMEYDLSVFTGNKFAIFYYATENQGGYIDVDWFSTEPEFEEEDFFGNDFDGYSDDQMTVDHLEINREGELLLMPGGISDLEVKAIFADGHSVYVTTAADYASSDDTVVSIVNGRLNALKDGVASVSIRYAGERGGEAEVNLMVTVSSFPLNVGYFNPSIWGEGYFDESTGETVVGQYGFAGWQYPGGLDMSDYRYCVAKIGECKEGGLSFRLFDTDSYWSDASENGFDKEGYSVVDLHLMKSSQGRIMDPSHIYIAGFWGYGNNPFIIEKVYLTNSDDPTLSIEDVVYDQEDYVDIYTLTGICIGRKVKLSEGMAGLHSGMYIIGNKKVLIK